MARTNHGNIIPPERVGRLRVGDPRVLQVQHVEVDGKIVRDVFDLDDLEGWVLHYLRDARTGRLRLDATRRSLVIEKVVGTVRVTWKPRTEVIYGK